ncbi:MAG TPA: hypothetical protein VKB75_08910 [Jatrophihabitans sp.]|nr:hypothetical protein [Jatrophihabitans sp.]
MTDEPPVDEELAQPRPSRSRRLFVVVAVVLLAVASGFAIARVVASGSIGRGSAAVPHSSVTPPPTRHVPPPDVSRPDNSGVLSLHAPPPCPRADDGQVACSTLRAVPSAFVAAVRGVVPHAMTTSALTNVLRPTGPEIVIGLWSRVYSAREGAVHIRIVISRGHDEVGILGQGVERFGHSSVFVRYLGRVYTVEVQVDGPMRGAPSPDAVYALAADPRLLRER